uniref:WAP domain-containing protein n=1 Tax=Apteryx owenii TaxID=8824 RepID=A0A8B9P4K7_APTOW
KRLHGSAWSCPPVRFTCAMVNPPNQCFFDWQCSRPKKCCNTFCGKKCISRPVWLGDASGEEACPEALKPQEERAIRRG